MNIVEHIFNAATYNNSESAVSVFGLQLTSFRNNNKIYSSGNLIGKRTEFIENI